MTKSNPFAAFFLLVLGTAAASLRLWWIHAPRMQQRYLADYCRYTLGIPSFSFWPYRIQAVQHLSPAVLQQAVFGGQPLYRVLLWPLIATAVAAVLGFVIALSFSRQPTSDRLLHGAPIVSHWRWNWPLWLRPSKRGFYIDSK